MMGDERKREEKSPQQFQFAVLCEYLDRIRRVPKGGAYAKQRIFQSLLIKWNEETERTSRSAPSFFPVLRLIVNAYDTRKFNMKSKKLISRVCKTLLLPDVMKKELLLTDSKSSCLAIRQLSKEVAGRNATTRSLSVQDVNEALDHVNDADLGEEELSSLLKRCSSERVIFWLMNILTRSVERCLGVPSSTIINWLHPNANQMRQAGTSLERICELCAEGKVEDDSCLLFRMFEPMLLARVRHGNDVFEKLKQYCGEKFYVQLKFDGEHFLVHYSNDGQFRYYSRNQNDFSEKIGPHLNNRLHSFIASSVESCILDTELLLWDTVDCKYVGKGQQASDGRVYDVKNLRDYNAVEPCLAVFDILFLNGKSLMNVPLKDRIALLHSGSVLQREDESVVFVGKFEVVSTRSEFAALYEKAMDDEEEGVVVKKMDSLYKIGVRHMVNGWFKVKPFHLGDESLDLAVVGVDRGRNGVIENYAVAVLRDDRYFIVGKVSRGLDSTTRKHLHSKLEKDRGWLSGKAVPSWIHEANYASDRPADYVYKENLQVVEVRAAGIINGRLHFPTIRFYRDDKNVKDIDKYEDFLDFEKNLRSQSLAAASGLGTSGRKRQANTPQVMDEYRVKKTATTVKQLGGDLKGHQICVLRGGPNVSAQKLREIIESFGGSPVANPTAKVLFVLTGEPNHLKSKSVIKSDKYNVVSAEWALECERAGFVRPISRKYALHVVDQGLFSMFNGNAPGKEEEEEMEDCEEEKEFTFDDINNMLASTSFDEDVTKEGHEALSRQLLKGMKIYQFYDQIYYLHDSLTSLTRQYARILLKMHGAAVVDSLLDSVTHVVAKSRDVILEPCDLGGRRVEIVDVAWIESAIGT